MQISVPLHELDTREVLPVPHGLLEQGLVGPAEVSVDLVGNHPVFPNALLSVSGGTGGAVS